MDSESLAWLAGIFDGEGSLTILRAKGGECCGLVNISNNDPHIITRTLLLCKQHGIPIPGLYSTRRCRQLTWSGYDAADFLRAIQPWVVGMKKLRRIQTYVRHFDREMRWQRRVKITHKDTLLEWNELLELEASEGDLISKRVLEKRKERG